MIGYYVISFLYVIVCLVLLLVILLQQGKGDMGSAFGGGGSGTAAFGARTGATLLTKATTVCAVLFMVGALVLAIIGQRGPRSLVSGTPAPPATTQQKTNPAAPTAPPQQATPPGSPAPVPASPAPQTPAPNPGK